MPQQDATAVVLPQYREPVVRPYQPGDYTTPSSKSELRQLDRPPPLGFQMQTAGENYDRALENYDRAHGFFKQLFDGTGLTEAAKDPRDKERFPGPYRPKDTTIIIAGDSEDSDEDEETVTISRKEYEDLC